MCFYGYNLLKLEICLKVRSVRKKSVILLVQALFLKKAEGLVGDYDCIRLERYQWFHTWRVMTGKKKGGSFCVT